MKISLTILISLLLFAKSYGQDNSLNINGDYPFTSKIILTDSILSKYSIHQLNFMRNEIFARHGYVFSSEPYITHFSKKNWYTPKSKKVTLTKIEQQNVKIIKDFELKIKPKIDIDKCLNKFGYSAGHKLELTYWELYLNNKHISSIHEILDILTDDEIKKIGLIDLNNNIIKSLDGIEMFENLETLYISGNYLTEIIKLNDIINLKDIDLSSNYISKIENLPKQLDRLLLSNNKISKIESIPFVNNYLSLDNNPIKQICIDLNKNSNLTIKKLAFEE